MKCLVLGGGNDQGAFIQELTRKNIECILIDYYLNPPARQYVDKHYQVSTLNMEEVKKIALEEKVDLIVTACTDQALLTVSKVSEELGLPCTLPYETAKNVTNKAYMKNKMVQNSIPTSRYTILDKVEGDIDLKYPLVIKPVDCNSSKGVVKVNSVNGLKDAIKNALEISRDKRVIVEEYKEGMEISVDAYINEKEINILAITETRKIKKKRDFTIVQSKFPVNIGPEQECIIKEIIENIVRVFKIDNSPLLIQMIVNGIDISVIEFSARMGGGSKYKLIEVISGIDIMKLYVQGILGEKVDFNYSKNTEYGVMNYCYCYPGKLKKTQGFEQLKERGVIKEFFEYKTGGSYIKEARVSGDRVTGYMVIGSTLEELKRKQSIIVNTISILDDTDSDILRRDMLLD